MQTLSCGTKFLPCVRIRECTHLCYCMASLIARVSQNVVGQNGVVGSFACSSPSTSEHCCSYFSSGLSRRRARTPSLFISHIPQRCVSLYILCPSVLLFSLLSCDFNSIPLELTPSSTNVPSLSRLDKVCFALPCMLSFMPPLLRHAFQPSLHLCRLPSSHIYCLAGHIVAFAAVPSLPFCCSYCFSGVSHVSDSLCGYVSCLHFVLLLLFLAVPWFILLSLCLQR